MIRLVDPARGYGTIADMGSNDGSELVGVSAIARRLRLTQRRVRQLFGDGTLMRFYVDGSSSLFALRSDVEALAAKRSQRHATETTSKSRA